VALGGGCGERHARGVTRPLGLLVIIGHHQPDELFWGDALRGQGQVLPTEREYVHRVRNLEWPTARHGRGGSRVV
jgi:hypothetical protein